MSIVKIDKLDTFCIFFRVRLQKHTQGLETHHFSHSSVTANILDKYTQTVLNLYIIFSWESSVTPQSDTQCVRHVWVQHFVPLCTWMMCFLIPSPLCHISYVTDRSHCILEKILLQVHWIYCATPCAAQSHRRFIALNYCIVLNLAYCSVVA